MTEEIEKIYNPGQVEDKWYRFWEEGGYFRPAINPGKETYTIVIPPPNVTGTLHMGHALDNTIQDILIRWKRMQGFDTLWMPGTDHAGIATQIKVEEHLAEEGLSRHDLGRAKFLDRVWSWKEEYHQRITNQLKKLGVSCDWSRERFTMDEGCSQAVREVFVTLYEKGLIYRGDYIINWCPRCRTALSDIEVEHEDEESTLTHLKYPLKDGSGHIVVATTRVETMLGDTAVAVNPRDKRYKKLVGQTVILPVVGREIPIIADEYVEMDFGSGAVKVTPAHDPNDFAMATRHQLPLVVVISPDGSMTEDAGKYGAMDRYAAREALTRELTEIGAVLKIEAHGHAVGHCQRCATVIEPLISKQWFVSMKPLAEPAIQAVREGDTRFVPERFTKVYLNWMENIRDWCISRQIWWGHRIPAWYCTCGETIVSRVDVAECPHCGGAVLEQDPDVLDTWFSSALWPFSTMGWPEETPDLKHFFPTQVLVTGYDIIYFWVARMIFMSLEFMGEVPFADVYIHGLVRDSQGRKMSKSLGNGVDPLEVIEKFGADTLRFTLITGQAPGNDLRFRQENVEASRNFANKIWNASRFVLMNLGDFPGHKPAKENLTLADAWIMHRYNDTVESVTRQLDKYELGEAARLIYEFLWSDFCDWYIELAKEPLYGEDREGADRTRAVLCHCLENTLRLLHPFMPFLTEEIWQQLPPKGDALIQAPWPLAEEEFKNPLAVKEMSLVMDIIRSIRNLRSEMQIAPRQRIEVHIKVTEEAGLGILQQGQEYIKKLAGVETLVLGEKDLQKPPRSLTSVVSGGEVYMPLAGVLDIAQESNRLQKELATIKAEVFRCEQKLKNEGFIKKAPPQIVEEERQKLNEYRNKRDRLESHISELR
jgi:valyl-tRNA synthetase